MEYYGDRDIDEISPDKVMFTTAFVFMTTIFQFIGRVNYIDVYTQNLLIGVRYFFETKDPAKMFVLQFFATFCSLPSYLFSVYISLPFICFFVAWWIIWYGYHAYPHPSNFMLNYFILLVINYFAEGKERIFTLLIVFKAITYYVNGFGSKSMVDLQLLILLLAIIVTLNDDTWPSLVLFISHAYCILWTFLKNYTMKNNFE